MKIEIELTPGELEVLTQVLETHIQVEEDNYRRVTASIIRNILRKLKEVIK